MSTTAAAAAAPPTSAQMAESKVSQFLTDQLNLEAMEVGFNCFLTHRPDLNQANQDNAEQEFINILEALAKENPSLQDIAVKHYISQVSTVKTSRKLGQFLDHLNAAVSRHVLPPRIVCDIILSSEKLSYKNADHWVASFRLVRRIVGGVDYKGVREIMKNCIEKAQSLPIELDVSIMPQVDALSDVLSYIFNRNAALLPGYFIVNEILKSYPENSSWPHWKLVPLVAKFLDSFRAAAGIVTCINMPRLLPVVELLGRAYTMSTWKLDPVSLKFLLKGNLTFDRILPYNKEVTRPQTQILRYLLAQPYSRDLIYHVLSLKKPNKENPTPGLCLPLQKQLIALLIEAMELSEEDQPGTPEIVNDMFRNLANDLIFFVLFQFVSFPTIIAEVAAVIETRQLRAGRDRLMWLLVQFISGSIQKNPTSDFMPVLRLFTMYDDETEPLPVPDMTDPSCVVAMSATGMFIHLQRKASSENLNFGIQIPVALRRHHEFLMSIGNTPCTLNPAQPDYKVALRCNTFSTTADLFQMPMLALVEAVGAGMVPPSGTAPMPGSNCSAALPIQPLSVDILDSLSVHSKMSLLHQMVNHIHKVAGGKPNPVSLSPSVVETYSRLLVYPELETLGIKGLLTQLLPKVFQTQAWNLMHSLLEIFSYRTHHVQAHYRLNFLNHINNMAGQPPLANNSQLYIMLESSALRLINGFGNSEISPPKPQPGITTKPSSILHGDSEELNRVLILTIARALHIGGLESNGVTWLKEVVTSIMNTTPHSWPSHTLQNFPTVLADLLKEHPGPKDNAAQLKKSVDEEWRNWTSTTNEMEIISHFSNSQGGSPLFLCLLWKMILENDEISPVAYKVLERISAKQLTSHLRTFCDFLVYEFSKSAGGGHVNKCIFAINKLIWVYNIITLDRLVLCMSLRHHEGEQAQVCFFIIQILLLKPEEFRNRVNKFSRTMSPEHHAQQDWHEKHMEFHSTFPEKFSPDKLCEKHQVLPVYYGNVCLRFLAVFDVVLHRFLELPQIQSSLETMLDHLGCLYKFHDKPITYLYNTLNYFENVLRDRSGLRRKIVSAITQSLKDVRPLGWGLSTEMCEKYLTAESGEELNWRPGSDYYHKLVQRVVQALDPIQQVFPRMDWRFNEFPNEGCHALYVTCVELMTLPVLPLNVGEKLIDVVLQSHSHIPPEKFPEWINALGLVMSHLPEPYWHGLHTKIEAALLSPALADWEGHHRRQGGSAAAAAAQPHLSPTQLFDYAEVHSLKGEPSLAYLLAIVHSTWHHAGFTQLCGILDVVRDKLVGLVNTEEQFLFLLHLVGPFLQRLHSDRFMRVLFDLTIQLYEVLLRVDKSVPHLQYIDAVCDLLYHIKYQFTGDSVKAEAERVVIQLRPALQLRLRFIAQVPIKAEEGVAKQEAKLS